MDISHVCRSCMKDLETWEYEYLDHRSREMFYFCTNIRITDDDKLSKLMCHNCLTKLETAYTFVIDSQKVDATLRNIIIRSETSIIVEPISHHKNYTEEFGSDNVLLTHESSNYPHRMFIEDENDNFYEINEAGHSQVYINSDVTSINYERTELNDPIDNHNINELNDPISNYESTESNDPIYDYERSETNDPIHIYERRETNDPINVYERSELNDPINNYEKTESNDSIYNTKTTESSDPTNIYERTEIRDVITSNEGTEVNDTIIPDETTDRIESLIPDECNNITNVDNSQSSENQIYVCPYCNKKFRTQRWFNKHMHNEHIQKKFSCNKCQKSFSKDWKLKHHLMSHTNERKFECTTCGKSFKLNKQLVDHARGHSETKPFACDKCGKRYQTVGCQ
ncbi:hypothetical protein ACJJTC_000353 [Scirpophaga incertulas]